MGPYHQTSLVTVPLRSLDRWYPGWCNNNPHKDRQQQNCFFLLFYHHVLIQIVCISKKSQRHYGGQTQKLPQVRTRAVSRSDKKHILTQKVAFFVQFTQQHIVIVLQCYMPCLLYLFFLLNNPLRLSWFFRNYISSLPMLSTEPKIGTWAHQP